MDILRASRRAYPSFLPVATAIRILTRKWLGCIANYRHGDRARARKRIRRPRALSLSARPAVAFSLARNARLSERPSLFRDSYFGSFLPLSSMNTPRANATRSANRELRYFEASLRSAKFPGNISSFTLYLSSIYLLRGIYLFQTVCVCIFA